MKRKERLIPFFCANCGERLGWTEDEPNTLYLYCDECSEGEENDS